MREIYEDDLRAHRGNVSMVAHCFGVERTELFEFIRVRPSLYHIVLGFREELVDNAEMHLYDAVSKKLAWAIQFTMQTLGKHRKDGKKTPETTKVEQFQGNLGKATIDQLTQVDEMINRPTALPPNPNLPEPEFFQQLDQAGDNVLNALVKYVGNQRCAAKELGVKTKQLADYLAHRPLLQATLNEKHEHLNDHAEYTLHDLIDAQEPWAIRFVLKTLGRSRGYSEIPLNDMMTLSGGLMITRLSSWDLQMLARLRGLVEPVPEKIGNIPVVAGSSVPAPMAATVPESITINQTAEPVAAAVKTIVCLEDAKPEILAAEPSLAVPAAPIAAVAAAEPVNSASEEQSSIPDEPEEESEPDPAPEQMSVNDLPVQVDVSRFTPEERRELEIVAARVFSQVKIREIYNPAWPDDHPIYREFDNLPSNEPLKSNGERAPPDST